jgi:hypothetical protein
MSMSKGKCDENFKVGITQNLSVQYSVWEGLGLDKYPCLHNVRVVMLNVIMAPFGSDVR